MRLSDLLRGLLEGEASPAKPRLLGDQRRMALPKRGLNLAEIDEIARHIHEKGLASEFEHLVDAFDEAAERLHTWVQSLPAFPARKRDAWDLPEVYAIERRLGEIAVAAEPAPAEGRSGR